jgi:hypothetical protein
MYIRQTRTYSHTSSQRRVSTYIECGNSNGESWVFHVNEIDGAVQVKEVLTPGQATSDINGKLAHGWKSDDEPPAGRAGDFIRV